MTDLLTRLESFAGEAPAPCWLGGDGADQGPSYCRACAERAVTAGKGEFVDGGWGADEGDSCRHCETCGKVLDYSLTKNGVAQELQHFSEHPPQDPLGPETAFHIARVLAAAPDEPEAVALAEAAVALLRALDQEPQT